MQIKQFEDKGLAHFSYAILAEDTRQIMLVDPARDPQPYYDYAREQGANIVGIIETHPHADFISSHLQIHQETGATIYTHSLVGADYPHRAFDEGDRIALGELTFRSLHTPGHSPDSISIVLEQGGHDRAVFTGDTLFIGDVGRPDLRESAGNVTAKREELARAMYHSTREKLMKLADDVVVYPAHGAGTLCGKALKAASSSTIGDEKRDNYALQDMSEGEFVDLLTAEQPFIPKYFGYDVSLNRQGAPAYRPSIEGVRRLGRDYHPEAAALIIDARPQQLYKQGHHPGAINIQEGGKFETWLGSIVGPDERYYLVAESEEQLEILISKAAKIGYEALIAGAFVQRQPGEVKSPIIDLDDFRAQPDKYTIVDIRNAAEVAAGSFFDGAVNIPLPSLRERAADIPRDKPVVVHCAGGYRSAAGSSIVEAVLPGATVLDLSEAVLEFKEGQPVQANS